VATTLSSGKVFAANLMLSLSAPVK